jgi:hypothetical protein
MPILHPISQTPIISFQRFREDSDWLFNFLKEKKVKIEPDSILDIALYIASSLQEWSKKGSDILQEYRLKDIISYAVGLSYLVRLIRFASKSDYFNNLQRLIKYIAQQNPIITSAGESSQERNFVFELEVASIFMSTGIDTQTNDEPDVRLNDKEIIWNIPCKMVYSHNNQTLGDRIEDGITQIFNFDCTYGIVAVGITNRIEHSNLLPVIYDSENMYGSFLTTDIASQVLQNELSSTFQNVIELASTRFNQGRENIGFRGILLVAHAICGVENVPTLLSQTGLIRRNDMFKEKIINTAEEILGKRFNDMGHYIFTN